jgi:hypothetical protein
MRGKSIAEFDRVKQVYQKHELSPLPFQPPPFYTYATSMLSGTFKVRHYSSACSPVLYMGWSAALSLRHLV